MVQEQKQAPGPFTWEDFIRLDEDDGRELVNRHLVEVDMPTRCSLSARA